MSANFQHKRHLQVVLNEKPINTSWKWHPPKISLLQNIKCSTYQSYLRRTVGSRRDLLMVDVHRRLRYHDIELPSTRRTVGEVQDLTSHPVISRPQIENLSRWKGSELRASYYQYSLYNLELSRIDYREISYENKTYITSNMHMYIAWSQAHTGEKQE